MIFVIAGIVIVIACAIVYWRTDRSILIKKDLIKPILLAFFSFAGCMLAFYPFIKYSVETTNLSKNAAYLQNEVKAENSRRGDISEALVWEITEHNEKVSQYFNGYDLWFGTPMFKHDTSKYNVSVEGYTIWKKEDIDTEANEENDTAVNEETTVDEIEDINDTEETTIEEDYTVIIDGNEYRLIPIPHF